MDLAPPVIPAAVPEYRDRSSGLVGFGIVQIILGAMCSLIIPFAFLGLIMQPANSPARMGLGQMAFTVLIYLLAAVVLIWLGIGSIKAQRWARTLTMVLSWSGIFFGTMGMLLMGYVLLFNFPPANGHAVGPGVKVIMLVFFEIFFGVFFVVLPAVMAWYYSQKDVKATCEARHPQPSWTDACPPTVLLLCLSSALGAAVLIVLPLSNNGTVPFLGFVVTGWAGAAVCLIQAAISGTCAWFLYHLKPAGWLLALGWSILGLVSTLLNALYLDYGELYRAMGYSEDKIQTIMQVNLHGSVAFVSVSIGILPVVALLAYTRRFFWPARANPFEAALPPA